MFQKEIVINNKTGLHARPASELAAFCTGFESDIIIAAGTDEEINAKSIISILSGGGLSRHQDPAAGRRSG